MSGCLPPWNVDERCEHNVHHVYPCYGRAHETDGAPCWCSPHREPVYIDGEIVGYTIPRISSCARIAEKMEAR